MMIKLILMIMIIYCFASAEKTYFQQYVNYNIKAKLDINQKAVNSVQEMLYKNNSPDTLNQLYFHLYMNKYRKDALTEDGQPRSFTAAYISIKKVMIDSIETLDYNLEKTLMRIPLDSSLAPGDSIKLQFEFKTKLPRSSGRFGYYGDHFAVGNWFPTPVNYTLDGWHLYPHIGNEFFQNWGDFYVELEVPKGFRVGATGNLVNSDELNLDSLNADIYYENISDSLEYVTWKYDAQNVHDFAWVADPNFKLLTYKYNDININYLIMAENYQSWKDNTEFSEKAMAFFEEKFGPYPYDQITIVDSYIRAGGMEYPNIVFINTFQHPDYNLSYFRAVILHEIVHNWFYGMLATNQTEDEWLDEGFTTFAEILAMEHLFGVENNYFPPEVHPLFKPFTYKLDDRWNTYLNYLRWAKRGGEEKPIDYMIDFFGRGAGISQYEKGAIVLFMLKYVLGDDTFWKGMKAYYDQWSFKHPNRRDFIRVMQDVSGQNLNWFFDPWLNTTLQLDLKAESIKNKSLEEGEYYCEIVLSDQGDIRMPFELTVITEIGDSLVYWVPVMPFQQAPNYLTALDYWYPTQPQYKYSFRWDSPVTKIIIDPRKKLADINYLNNSTQCFPQMDFYFMKLQSIKPPLDSYMWEIWPTLQYNDIDKLKPGIILDGSYLNIDHKILLKTWYKTYTQRVDFSFSLEEPLTKIMGNSGIKLHAFSMDGVQGATIGLNTRLSRHQNINLNFNRYAVFDRNYSLIPWQGKYYNIFRFNYGYSEDIKSINNYLTFKASSATSIEGSSTIFSKAEILLSNLFYFSNPDYRFYIGIRYGRSSGKTPRQEQLSLGGAGLNQAFSNDLYRSKGSLPVQWQREGNVYLKNIAQVRGVLSEDLLVFNNNLLVSSFEFMFPNLLEVYNLPLVSEFNPYIFSDIGSVWDQEKPQFKDYVKSAGFGFSYRTGFVLSRALGLERIDLEFPLWLGNDLEKIKAKARWALFLQFDTDLTPLF